MIRNFKVLGLALVAVLATSAVAASAALAVEHTFKHDSANGRAILTGDDEGLNWSFSNTPGAATKVECNASFRATQAEANTDSLEVKPTYTNCKFGANVASMNTNGCATTYDSDTNANGHGQVQIVCENGGESIEFAIPGISCTLKFGAQTFDGGVSYENKGGGAEKEDITIKFTATGIDFTKSGAGCFLVSGGTTAVLEGSSTVKAYEDLNSSPANATTPGTTTEGSQVNATLTTP